MGTNVIQLADYRIPSYRRPRHPAQAGADTGWSSQARRRAARTLAAVAAPHAHATPPTSVAAPRIGPAPVLRVTQLSDPSTPDAPARLRISGRLIDVCAELDRLAAAEAARAALPPRRA